MESQTAAAVSHEPLEAPVVVKGELAMRVVAAVIDGLISVPVFLLLRWIPVVGDVLSGLMVSAYWLLRDSTGASPGKVLIGYRVAAADGSDVDKNALMKRNLPLALGVLPSFVPFLGWLLGFVGVFVFAVELVMLIATGGRIGDRWGATTVVQAAPKSS